jgi:hypothetical protein
MVVERRYDCHIDRCACSLYSLGKASLIESSHVRNRSLQFIK